MNNFQSDNSWKKNNTAGGWKLKLISSFMEAIHEPVHLYKLSLVQ